MERIVRRVADGGFSFFELLLDENLCSGTVWVDTELVKELGGVNTYLAAKQKYELLLRAALDVNVELYEGEKDDRQYVALLDDEPDKLIAAGWKTDCYVIGKYSELLREHELFNLCLQAVIKEAQEVERLNKTLLYLEQMIGRTGKYWQIDEGAEPILIYCEGRIECDVLNTFSKQLGLALEQMGKKVILYNCKEMDMNQWMDLCMGQHFQAVIGMQSAVFSEKADRVCGKYLHDYVHGPKFNYIFDHPVMMHKYLEYSADDFYLLLHDAGHMEFAEKYLKKRSWLMPLAGIKSAGGMHEEDRCYDITFIGIYGDYRKEVRIIHQMNRRLRFIANRFLLKMRRNTNLTAEQALTETLAERGIYPLEQEFLELLYELCVVISCVMHYYRDRVIHVLLESGLCLDVFGESWQNCPLRRYSNLRCHPAVTVQESISVWQKSKLSLNIMSWHKSGFTERMAQIMMEKAVLITDTTAYLDKNYGDRDLLAFQLEKIDSLPGQIHKLLADTALRKEIAENGWQKTIRQHTWDIRAAQFLEILHSRMEAV